MEKRKDENMNELDEQMDGWIHQNPVLKSSNNEILFCDYFL